MPLDPIIANPAQAKLNDPLETYNNFLLASGRKSEMDKIKRGQEVNNALNELYKQNTDAQGNTNWNALRAGVAQRGIGEAIPGILQQEGERAKLTEEAGKIKAEAGLKTAETAHEATKQQKTGQEAFEKAFTNHKEKLSGISTDPKVGLPQLVNWTMEQFADPVMGPILRAQGITPEVAIAELKETIKVVPFATLLLRLSAGNAVASAQKYETINTQDRMVTKAFPANSLIDPGEGTVVSEEKVGKDPNAEARATRVNVNVPVNVAVAQKGANKFSEKVMEGKADEFKSLEALSKNAPSELAAIDKALNILNSGDVITGAGAPFFLGVAKLAKALNIPITSDKTIQNTEMLQTQIAKNLLDRLAALKANGVSLTPMSNMDLEQLRNAGPNAVHDPATLRDMFQRYREMIVQKNAEYKQMKADMEAGKYTDETMGMYAPAPAATPAYAPVQGTNGKMVPPSVVQRFLANRNNPAHIAEIDRLFGAGTAARLKGGN